MRSRSPLLAALGLVACAGDAELARDAMAPAEDTVDAVTETLAVDRTTPVDARDVGADTPRLDAPDAGSTPDTGSTQDTGSIPDARDASGPDAPPRDGTSFGPVLYPLDASLSPITPSVAAGLRAIAARGAAMDDRVFAKVGASNTVYVHFLQCFAGSNVDLAGRDHLRPTIDFLRAGNAAGSNPFQRTSQAATVGWSAWSALAGTPAPLDRELDAIRPRQAVVLFGTNDIESRNLARYAANMLDITDRLVARGVVPLLTTVPPRDDDRDADAWVPRYNAVVRGIAQARQVPLIDLHRELVALPGHGMGPDGIHMNVYVTSAGARGCALGPAGLRYGFNVRNLLTVETLHRVLGVLSRGAPPPDADAPRLRGNGAAADPFEVTAPVFTDLRDTSAGGTRAIASYPGCAAPQDESGPEYVYRLVLERRATVRAWVFTRGAVDIDLHLLGDTVAGERCVARDDRSLVRALDPGTWHFVLDTYVPPGGAARAGEYLFVLLVEP